MALKPRPDPCLQDVRDHDAEVKGKSKLYADSRRHASYSDVALGDPVLVQQDKTNKLSTTFKATPHKVIAKSGNSVVVESPEGARYNRNTTHVKKFVIPEEESQTQCQEPTTNQDDTADATPSATRERPVRERRAPDRLKDYVTK